MKEIVIATPDNLEEINLIRTEVTSEKTNGYTLRRLNPDDIEETKKSVTLVYRGNKSITGYILLQHTNLFNNKGDAILDVFIRPSFQNQGIGTELIQYTTKYAKQYSDYNRLTLGVLHSNLLGIVFFQRNGFNTFREDDKGKYMAIEIKDSVNYS